MRGQALRPLHYRPEDFDELTPPPPPALGNLVFQVATRQNDHPPSDLRPMYEGCTFLQHCWEERTELSLEEFEDLVNLLLFSELDGVGGERLIHVFGRDHPGYVASTVDDQIEQARERGEPATCNHIARRSGRCGGCPYLGKLSSPVMLGRPMVHVRPSLPASGETEIAASADIQDAEPKRETDEEVLSDLAHGLAEVLQSFGGTAATTEVLAELRSERGAGHYATLRTALDRLLPDLPRDRLPDAFQLTGLLRSHCERPIDGVWIERLPRGCKGVRWAVRRWRRQVA